MALVLEEDDSEDNNSPSVMVRINLFGSYDENEDHESAVSVTVAAPDEEDKNKEEEEGLKDTDDDEIPRKLQRKTSKHAQTFCVDIV